MTELRITERHLAAMPIEELVELSEKIREIISRKVDSEKRIIASKLARIEKYEIIVKGPGPKRGKPTDASPNGRKVPAKYRDPNSGATWSGRGLLPRWLKAAMKTGAKREDFRIVDS